MIGATKMLATRGRWLHLLVAPAILSLSSCYFLQSARVPLETMPFTDARPEHAEDLMVVLPGILDGPEDFAARGFVGYVRSARSTGELPFDVVGVNAHLGYYRNRTILERLETEIIAPARTAGYRRVHLLGISMGGFGALLYLRKHPQHIASVTLLAPYLGEAEAYDAAAAVDFDASTSLPPENLWPWIMGLDDAQLAKLHLGYGDRDRFATLHRHLAARLPSHRVVRIEGGHDWVTWSELWPTLLERLAGINGSRSDDASQRLALRDLAPR